MQRSLGMIEVLSIPVGIEAADAMMKAASVELVTAQAVCAGKYIAVITGDVSGVNSAVKAGAAVADIKLINSLVIPNVHEQVPMAINACTDVKVMGAVGAVETYSLCSAVIAADEAVKAADITLIEIRLGRGLGGKSFVTMTGEVSAVEASVRVVEGLKEVQGLMADAVVIPSPHPDIANSLF